MSFGQSHGLTPLKMSFLWPFLKLQFFPLKIILFFPKHQKRCFLIEFLFLRFLDKIHGLTPLKKFIFWSLLKLQFFGLKMIVSYLKYPKKIFSDIIPVKNSNKKNSIFGQNP